MQYLKAGIHAFIDLKAPGSYSVGFILVLKNNINKLG